MLALRAARADVTQYRIWYNSHTHPFIGQDSVRELVLIDIKALAEYVDRLNWLYFRTQKLPEWLNMLTRLDAAIADRRWRRHQVYFKCLAMSLYDVDIEKIRREFELAGPVDLNEEDIDLLQMKVQLQLHDLPLQDKILLLDRIIVLCDEPSEKLQYKIAKAIQYFLVDDKETATSQISDAIKSSPKTPNDASLRLLTARAKQILAMLQNDKRASEEAILEFHELIARDEWTSEGVASLWREVADAKKAFADWPGAEAAYRKILELHPQPVVRSLLAESLAEQGRPSEAYELLGTVDLQILDEHEKYDHLMAEAAAALGTGELEQLTNARTSLQSLKPKEPFFAQRQLRTIITLSDAMLLASAGQTAISKTPEKTPLEKFNEMVLLRPAVFGVGLNINAIIDNISKAAKDKKKKSDQRN